MSAKRFYRAEVYSALGKKFTVSFEAENIMLAYDHAEHVCRQNDYSCEIVRYIGKTEPEGDFGTFQPA